MFSDNKACKAKGKYIVIKTCSEEGREYTDSEIYKYYDVMKCICDQHFFETRAKQYSHERALPLKELHPYKVYKLITFSSENICIYTTIEEILEEYMKDTSKGHIWQYSIYELQEYNAKYVINLADVYIKQLQNKNHELETMLHYQPDGAGAHKAKAHFESLCTKEEIL